MHTDACTHAGADAIVASAQARGVPVVSAGRCSTWLDGRNGSSFDSIAWSGGTPDASRSRVGAGATACAAMVPATFGGRRCRRSPATAAPVTFTRETIKGVEYAFFPAAAAHYAATYAADTTPPVISSVAAHRRDRRHARPSPGRPTSPPTRACDYGTDRRRADARAPPTRARVTAHSVKLTGLTPGHDLLLPRALRRRVAATRRPRRRPGRAGDVQEATWVRLPAACSRSRRARCARGPASRLSASDNTLYEGQLDNGQPAHDLPGTAASRA